MDLNAENFLNKEVRQGCSISLTIFNLHLDDAVREWKLRLEILSFSDAFSEPNVVKTLMFADDLVIIAEIVI